MEVKFVKKENSIPLYRQIAEWMMENITFEYWKKGHKLPAEEDLAKHIDVSRGTVRKAISLLIEQGLLIQVQGKGTFVEKQKISYPFAQELISFAESMESKGYTFRTNVLEMKVVKASPDIQHKLGLGENEAVFYLKRVRFIKHEPAILLENWVSLKYCYGIEYEDFEQTSLFKAIEKRIDGKINLGIRNFSAKSLDKEQADLLGLEVSDPVLYIDQITFGLNQVPVECSHILLRTDKYEVTSILTR
jgi:DNA-binding GntR family transcriptional regulator